MIYLARLNMTLRLTMRFLLLAMNIAHFPQLSSAQQQQASSIEEQFAHAQRILFLGDSITYAGHYIHYLEAWSLAQRDIKPAGSRPVLFLNLGLPSETVSGLSEQGHAGGRFPRPNLKERLDRVLSKTTPDLVVACYGMNCAIYQPLAKDRFTAYQRGMEQLRQKVVAADAQFIAVTPPIYDDQQRPLSFSYDNVLKEYADWLVSKQRDGWCVIDLHAEMRNALLQMRDSDGAFTFAPDGVHPNLAGHWVIASTLIRALGDTKSASAVDPQTMLQQLDAAPQISTFVAQRSRILRDAYLSATKHIRPGLPAGLSLEAAEEEADLLTRKIRALMNQAPPPDAPASQPREP